MATKLKDITVNGGVRSWPIRIRINETTGMFSATFPSVDKDGLQQGEQEFVSPMLSELEAMLKVAATEADAVAFRDYLSLSPRGITSIKLSDPIGRSTTDVSHRLVLRSTGPTHYYESGGVLILDTPEAWEALAPLQAEIEAIAGLRAELRRREVLMDGALMVDATRRGAGRARFLTLEDARALVAAVVAG